MSKDETTDSRAIVGGSMILIGFLLVAVACFILFGLPITLLVAGVLILVAGTRG